MKIKKLSAGFAFLALILLFVHVIYELISFIFYFYNPIVQAVLGFSTAGSMLLHGILASVAAFGLHDSKKIHYKKRNVRTLLQRISAGGILVMMPLHTFAYSLLQKTADSEVFFVLLCIGVLFFAMVFTHVAVSFTNGLVTFGWLEDGRKKKILDLIIWIICGILFVAASIIITVTEMKMFLG